MKLILKIALAVLVLLCTHAQIQAQSLVNTQKTALATKTFEDSTQNTILRKSEKKSPTGALLRSLVFPGWGQWYNDQKIKAGIAFAAEGFFVGLAVYNNDKMNHAQTNSELAYYRDKRNLSYWLLGGVVLLSMLDAYVDAYLYDFDAGPDLSMRVGVVSSAKEIESPKILGLSLRAQF